MLHRASRLAYQPKPPNITEHSKLRKGHHQTVIVTKVVSFSTQIITKVSLKQSGASIALADLYSPVQLPYGSRLFPLPEVSSRPSGGLVPLHDSRQSNSRCPRYIEHMATHKFACECYKYEMAADRNSYSFLWPSPCRGRNGLPQTSIANSCALPMALFLAVSTTPAQLMFRSDLNRS